MAKLSCHNLCVDVFDSAQPLSIKRLILSAGTYKRPMRRILSNVTLEAQDGEAIGILGLNGSGKTTLIKALAGIYPISEGSLSIEGRLTAMTLSGLGLDPEFTVLENIKIALAYSGRISSYNEAFKDEVLAFSELEGRENTLYKHLSSGFQSRLAFALAIKQRTDILLIDETLGVGDLRFIEKAKNAVNELIHGSSIAFIVSHTVEQIIDICNRCIVIHQGEMVFQGSAEEGAEFYQDLIGMPKKNKKESFKAPKEVIPC